MSGRQGGVVSWGRFVGGSSALLTGARGRPLRRWRQLAASAALLAAAVAGVLAWQVDGAGADASCDVPPTGLTATLSDDGASVVLAWDASTCDPATYAVHRRTMSDPTSRMTQFATVDGTTLTYTDTTVEAGATYRYRIRSNDQGRRSGYADVTVPESTSGSAGPEQQTDPTERSTVPRNDVTLVSNLSQTDNGNTFVGNSAGAQTRMAIAFTTGSADGYTLTRVDLLLESIGANADPKVTIATGGGTNPGSTVHTLTDPASLSDGAVNAFAAPANTLLDPNTTYFVVVENDSTTDSAAARFNVEITNDNGNDSGSLADWSIANEGRRFFGTNWGVHSAGSGLKIGLTGTVRTNNDATGAPTISGTATVGQTLTAATSGITDTDGLTGVSYSYQWLRFDADGMSNETEVGSDSTTYTLVEDDEGKKIKVKVTFTDNEGFAEELTSAAYPATGTVAATDEVTLVSNIDENSNANWTLSPSSTTVQKLATAFTTGSESGYTVAVVDLRLGQLIDGPNPKVTIAESDGTNPSSTLYTLIDPDSVSASSTNRFTAPQSAHLEPNTSYFVVVENTGADPSQLGIIGTTSDEESGGLSDWSIADSSRSSASTTWQGAGGSSLKFKIRGLVRTNNAATGAPTISGTATVGEELTAATSGISDTDGLTGVSYSYQWLRFDSDGMSNETEIGSDSTTYTLVEDDEGKKIKVKVTFTDNEGFAEELTSAAFPTTGTVAAASVANATPTFGASSTSRTLLENTPAGMNVGAAVEAMDDDDTLMYTLYGTDASSFDFETSSGQIKTKAEVTYDFETKAQFSVTVGVSDLKDADGNADTAEDDSIAVTIRLGNVNEISTLTGDSDLEMPENTPTTTTFGSFVLADPDATRPTPQLVGADNGHFNLTSISPNTYVLKFRDVPNYEMPADMGGDHAGDNVYVFTIRVADSDFTVDLPVTVTVLDVNEAPTITTTGSSYTALSFEENTPTSTVVATYEADDVDADDMPLSSNLTWSLSGDDAGDFTITRNTDGDGELKFVNSPNFESPVDDDMDNDYEVIVEVRDGRADNGDPDSAVDASLPVTVSVTNEDEDGTVTITGALEGGSELTASVTDIDGNVTGESWQWARAEPGTDSFTNISSATMPTYTPVAADVGKILRATVGYTDPEDSGKSASAVTGTIGASNTHPEFSAETASREVPENSAPGTAVGAPVSTTDNENDELNYSLASTGDGSSFTIEADSGQIKTKSGITYNFESSKKSYTVTVNVRDSKDAAGNTDTATDDTIVVTITLTDVNEAPTITNPPTAASVAENTPDTTAIVTYAASDVDDADTEEWSVEPADDGDLFEIDQMSGALKFKESPDFETRRDMDDDNVYKVTVKVTDSGGLSATTAMTPLLVTVTNVNEPPTITSREPSHTEPSFEENGTAVVAVYTATDMDAGTVFNWTVEGNDAGLFTITKNTSRQGELKFKAPPNFEDPQQTGPTANEYQVTVKVTDNHSPTLEDTVGVVVTVKDLNEAPKINGATSLNFREFRYNSTPPASNTDMAYRIASYTAADEDGDAVTWSLEGDDAEHLAVYSTSTIGGALYFDIAPVAHPVTGAQTARPDYERPIDTNLGGSNTYNVTLVATDMPDDPNHSPLTTRRNVTVTVTNVNEVPDVLDYATTTLFPEIAYDLPRPTSDTVRHVRYFSLYDEEEENIDCTRDGPDLAALLVVNTDVAPDQQRCEVRFAPGKEPNFEDPADANADRTYQIRMLLNDGTSSGLDVDVLVEITDVDETPEIVNPPADREFPETAYDSNVTPDVVATFVARDEEDQVISWDLSGEDANDFDITKNADGEGVVTFKSPPDFERPTDGPSNQNSDNVYMFTVEATDTSGNTGSWNYQVTVIDVNERPEFIGTPPTAITYDENDTATVAAYSARDEEEGLVLDGASAVTWTLIGTDSGDFSIDSDGTVTFSSPPDWEDPDDDGGDNVYQFTVVATDKQLLMSPRLDVRLDVTVTVDDVEEDGTIKVNEDDKEVGLNPAVGDEILFTLSDPDGGIVLEPGDISWRVERRLPMGNWETVVTGGPLSLETGYRPDEDDTGYQIRAVATYTDRRGSGKTAESEPTAAVTADPIVNAPPRVTAGTCDVPEGAGGRNICSLESATDRDGDSLTFALASDADAATFEVNASTGQLRAVGALDFETTVGPILVPVNVADGRDIDGNAETDFVSDVTATFAINVLDVEEDGVVTLSNADPAVGDTVTASLSDGDGSISGRSWQWWRSVNGRTNWVVISGATSTDYTASQHDANFFLRATASYSDNRGGGKRAEAVTAQPVFSENQRPSFPSTETGQRSVAENVRGANVGDPVAATDPERDRLTYSLSGADAAAFTVVASTGQIRTREPLDFEAKSSYTFTVEVHDGKDGQGNPSTVIDDTVSVTVTVDNVDEPGEITLTTLTATISARVEVTAVLDDPDGVRGAVAWQWHRSPNGRSGWVQVAGATSERYTPTLEADAGSYLRANASYTDGHGGGKTAEKVSSRVGNPPPINAAPAFGATETGRRSIAENASGGDPVGDPVTADDFNNDTLTYTLGGTDAATFAVDGSSGQLRLASGAQLDFETKRSYRVVVSVSDGADANDDLDNDAVDDTITVTIEVTDVNEAPVLTGDTSPVVVENTRSAVATYRGADPERDTLTWSVNNDAFWISQQGQLWFAVPPSFEDGTSHRVTVEAVDPEGLSDTLDVTVTVTDVEEQGVVRLTPRRGWVGTRFTAALTDDDGSTSGISWQWSRSRSRSRWDDIPNATSATYTATDDDIGHYLQVTASYSDRRGSNKEASAVLAARIAGAADKPSSNTAPEFADASVTRSVGGGTAPGRPVGAPVRGDDADQGEVLTYTLSGPDAELFDIDPATGQLRTKGVLDPDLQNTHTVVVEVRDGFDGSYDPADSADDTVEVTIAITALSMQRSTSGGFGGGGGGSGGGGGGGGGGGDLDIGVATFVVANGWSPADVGTASVLAARTQGAVVVYTAGDELSSETADLLREAQPANVLIVGGTAAVSTGVRSQIRAVSSDSGIARIIGQDRTDTAASAARRVLGLPHDAGSVTLVIANGWSPPDIGAAAALAARSGRAAVAYTQRNVLPESTAALVRDYEIARVFVVGGTAAVSDAVADRVTALAPDATVTRLVGTDRIDTAAQAARRVLGSPQGAPRGITLVIANGWSPPDAGVAAAFAAATDNAAVAYTARDTLPEATAALIRDYRPARVIILGGRAAVTDNVRTAIAQAATDTTVIQRITGSTRTDTAARAAYRILRGP